MLTPFGFIGRFGQSVWISKISQGIFSWLPMTLHFWCTSVILSIHLPQNPRLLTPYCTSVEGDQRTPVNECLRTPTVVSMADVYINKIGFVWNYAVRACTTSRRPTAYPQNHDIDMKWSVCFYRYGGP